jgi:hypothetical protein
VVGCRRVGSGKVVDSVKGEVNVVRRFVFKYH